jgi:hypothetical protein
MVNVPVLITRAIIVLSSFNNVPPLTEEVSVKKSDESQQKSAKNRFTFVHGTDEKVVFCEKYVT